MPQDTRFSGGGRPRRDIAMPHSSRQPSPDSQHHEHTSVFVTFNGIDLVAADGHQNTRFGDDGCPRRGPAMA